MEIYAVKIIDINSEQLDELSLLIDSRKRHRIKKYVKKKNKLQTLMGEILLRSIIIQKLNINNKDIIFNNDYYGKPHLKNYPNVFFNLSHSGDFVVCAFDEYPVGIDIEKIKDIEYEDLAKNFFTNREYDYIMKNDLDQQLNKFYDIWTLKESYIKCCGKGLSLSLKSFSIEISGLKEINVIMGCSYTDHKLQILEFEFGYRMAVCTLNKENFPYIKTVNQSELIDTYKRLYNV
ncbi:MULTISPECIES: 4'-phosphopantetheinyl transferase family protein [Bacillus cereus group]|uniref:4'-phosphopantetheinyl transferase family protein n=1 Tax=Bacillus cereus group TaxID=86661 RepID=UPI000ADCCC91|nr:MULTISPECIES: 4'-phosphopantetheinyl transferase superfamily protein [Bacillus cereus group]MCP1396572.1 4'-phosphopantetheinyl transferase [Bacillus cereus]MED2919686.1 4'-phosphopantetheinyl transferase superfamily protein [Bacillus thuringiensis]MED2925977.1 4'-phosphopantetheinyl transferase superfamily protein [Bacillus thuringiensis]MED3050662.1 4'-phosphopantetheinyl transferase superfamily protein [Bacillus thuringiensis]MED3686284.1 4'-phosphopantetheinyl transferase superfamily pr